MPKGSIQDSGAFNTSGGRYHPPDFFNSGAYKKMSVHSFNTGGKHPLADRARKWASERILICRFEMPFDIWCGHCKAKITMGIRFNAEKKRAGKFHTTPVYSFGLKCCFCAGKIIMETDPQNTTYKVVEGGRVMVKDYDATDDPNAIALDGRSEWERKQKDPIFGMREREAGKARAEDQSSNLSRLQKFKERETDTYKLLRGMKRKFREDHGLFLDRAPVEAEQKLKFGGVLPALTDKDREEVSKVEFQRPTKRRNLGDTPKGAVTGREMLAVAEAKKNLIKRERAFDGLVWSALTVNGGKSRVKVEEEKLIVAN